MYFVWTLPKSIRIIAANRIIEQKDTSDIVFLFLCQLPYLSILFSYNSVGSCTKSRTSALCIPSFAPCFQFHFCSYLNSYFNSNYGYSFPPLLLVATAKFPFGTVSHITHCHCFRRATHQNFKKHTRMTAESIGKSWFYPLGWLEIVVFIHLPSISYHIYIYIIFQTKKHRFSTFLSHFRCLKSPKLISVFHYPSA